MNCCNNIVPSLAFAVAPVTHVAHFSAPLCTTRRRHLCAPFRAVATSPDTGSAQQPVSPASPVNFRITVITASATAVSLHPYIETLLHSFSASVVNWRQLSSRASEAFISLADTCQIAKLRDALYQKGKTQSADFVLQEDCIVREPKRLAVFDLDSTLIMQETIDELAAQVNVEQHVKAITHRAMNGEIGFREALADRVALLKGLPLGELQAVKDRVSFTPGAHRLIRTLKNIGCCTAVVSGGFHFLADYVRDELGLDYCYANRLEQRNGLLTGRTLGEIVDAEFKENTLLRLAQEKQLRKEQVLAVGDGSNDLLMINRAGTGVAFNAKPIVQQSAKCRVNQSHLSDVLYLLGMSDEEIQATSLL